MGLRLILAAACVLLGQIATAAQPKKLFDVSLEDIQGGGRVLSVGFYGKLPPPSAVDKILRQSLEHAVLVDGSKNILATASIGDDNLNSNQYSGQLVYDARTKKIVTYNEYAGIKTTTTSATGYIVEVEENKTLAGIAPTRKWLTVTLVFPKQPAQDAAYGALLAEAEKLAQRRLDMNLYVSIGDPKVKTSWKQMRDKDGAYVFAEYSAATKEVARKGRLLRQLP
jgi:hypothetical protein